MRLQSVVWSCKYHVFLSPLAKRLIPLNNFNFFMLPKRFSLILFLTGCSFSNENKVNQPESTCINRVEKIVQGDSMEPMHPNGEGIIFLENYYECVYPVETDNF